MVLQGFGIADVSPVHVTQILRGLNMSHTAVGGLAKPYQMDIDGLSHEQPIWPVVIERIKNVPRVQNPRERCVYFVCDSRAALNYTNLSQALWPENRVVDLRDSIKQALIHSANEYAEWRLQVNEPHIAEYVKVAVKPSFINHIQAIVQKITPYAKSKETRLVCITYLAGGIGILALRRYLKSSLKLA